MTNSQHTASKICQGAFYDLTLPKTSVDVSEVSCSNQSWNTNIWPMMELSDSETLSKLNLDIFYILLVLLREVFRKLRREKLRPKNTRGRGGASIPGVQKNTKSEDSWAVYNFKIIWGGRKNNIILDMLHLLCLHLPCSCTISLHYICSSNICMRSLAFFLFLLPVHDDHCCSAAPTSGAEVNISSYPGTRCAGIIFWFSCSCIQVRCLMQKYWSGTVMRNTECGAALDPMICIGTR